MKYGDEVEHEQGWRGLVLDPNYSDGFVTLARIDDYDEKCAMRNAEWLVSKKKLKVVE